MLNLTWFLETFGANSQIYSSAFRMLKDIWKKANADQKNRTFASWRNVQTKLYGKTSINLFFTQTYLALIAKLIRNELFQISAKPNSKEDIFEWIFSVPDAATSLVQTLSTAVELLKREKLDRDIFKDLYEDLVSKSFRVQRGEYNTPDWLAELMIDEVKYFKHFKPCPRIIDPACGTGTFLFNAIKKLSFYDFEAKNVVGIDINPLMVEIAKTNYLLALGKNQTMITDEKQIPVFCLDTLELLEKNFKPFGEFDVVIGNPPWGSLRDIRNSNYQKFLKKMAIEVGLIDKKDTHLFTQIEVSTVFFVYCTRFLRENGIIMFVMPRSTISATMQNYNFLRAENFGFQLMKILDLESVKPLFNMPTCVLIGQKSNKQIYPINLLKYSALLPSSSCVLEEAKPYLSIQETQYKPEFFLLGRKSYYYNLFKTGVCIFPRSFYFVSVLEKQNGLIKVKTSDSILKKNVKNPWKISLQGLVEPEFIYYTVLGWEILPYTYANLRPVILPVFKNAGKFQILSFKEMEEKNLHGIKKWFEEVEKIWQKKRTPSSKNRFPSIIDRFNYGNLLTHQSPLKRFIVLYTATGRDLASCIVDRQKLPSISIDGETLSPDFVADVKTWVYETNDYDEATFLCGLLNSDVINKRIKPLQPRGLGGERAIHRRPLMLNIPKFDRHQEIHMQVSRLASINVETAHNLKKEVQSRTKLKEILPYRDEINNLVEEILHAS